MGKKARRATLQIEFEKNRRREHAADASAVGSQVVAVATLTKNLLSEFKKDQEFLVNARPLRRGSLVIPLEVVFFEAEDLLTETPVFEALRRMLRSFFDLRIRLGAEAFIISPGNRIVIDDQVIQVDPLVFDTLRPTSEETRLFSTAFKLAADDPTIEAVELRSTSVNEPLARVTREQFRRFHQPIVEERLLAPKSVSSRETLVIRSVAFAQELSWHFVWQGRAITAQMRAEKFSADVESRREVFRSGDRLVVELERMQEYDGTARTHIDRRFTVTHVYEHVQATMTGDLFSA